MTVFTNLAGLGLFSTWQNLEITLTFGHFLCLPEIIVFLIYCKKIDAYARQDLNLVLCRVGVWIVSLDAPFDIIIFCNNFERKTRTPVSQVRMPWFDQNWCYSLSAKKWRQPLCSWLVSTAISLAGLDMMGA